MENTNNTNNVNNANNTNKATIDSAVDAAQKAIDETVKAEESRKPRVMRKTRPTSLILNAMKKSNVNATIVTTRIEVAVAAADAERAKVVAAGVNG